ncbi:MAG: gamma-glutamylcyclotransferase family protein [Candidatus Competibacteraceae bacterium]|jgi:hypothetical protein|nr:gamma-glutamylcyclotransferase family protein [Candidatus Competibacteraceae bacterium]
MNYFAYGSNLHPARLQQRTPSCRALGIARLPGFALRFHKRGRDGSGKGNAFHTGNPNDQVWGAIYSLAAEEKPRLDQAESLGQGYDVITQSLVSSLGVVHDVFFYVADPAYIDDALWPYTWYKELVVRGARKHRLASAYIEQIEQTSSIDDPDATRHAAHCRILQTIAR